MGKLRLYLAVLREIQQQVWVRWLLYGWSFLAAYDLILSQIVPPASQTHFPKAWQLYQMTSGLMPWWSWLLILAGIVIVALLQYIVGEDPEERISFIGLLKEAEKRGVNFKGESKEILRFCSKLRQAGTEGSIRFWGSNNRYGTDPLHLIQPNHWISFRIYWEAAFRLGSPSGHIEEIGAENSYVNTQCINPRENLFYDLHLTKLQAIRWLRRYVGNKEN